MAENYDHLIPLEVLERVRNLLSDPNRWMKGRFSDKGCGYSRLQPLLDDSTCRFCLVGAFGACMTEAQVTAAIKEGGLTHVVSVQLKLFDAPTFNDRDDTTHEMVLEVLDETIARRKQAA
jgi:hypothetical protein